MIRIDTSNLNELRVIALLSNSLDQGAFILANDDGEIL